MLQQLAELISISFRCVNRTEGFHKKKPVIRCIKLNLIDHPTRNNEVVTVFKIKGTHECLEFSRSFVNENQFISTGIFIEVIRHRHSRRRNANVNIIIHQQGSSAVQEVILGSNVKSDKFSTDKAFLKSNFGRDVNYIFNCFNFCGTVRMIK